MDKAIQRGYSQVQADQEEHPPCADAESQEGGVELDGHLPSRVHRLTEEYQRRTDKMLRHILRSPGQLCRDQEQAQARHLASADDASHSHSQGAGGNQQRRLRSPVQPQALEEEALHRHHQEESPVTRILSQERDRGRGHHVCQALQSGHIHQSPRQQQRHL